MGTEILHPQDFLNARLTPSPNPRSFRRSAPRSEPKRLPPRKSPNPNPNLVMGQVTILKRGESLDSMRVRGNDRRKAVSFDDRDLIVTGTERLGPEPESVKKEVRMADLRTALAVKSDVYAGSAFSQSPSPSSLPLPTFSRRKEGIAVVDDSATKDLRRLLRIG
ncbi:hypothetical protein CKAN_00506700 [Cinnamomum micranthum f. kanehirae]|uniref:Uncharacterized protein n=1 Tax=Cinnamomum micranthum f. kanehirae TaxID=337451 RepID=A0A443NDK1_9MAGN|nr:hypothetical protein CKAN_00506700 [Cinnamomum micranthum f. kanehirae]